MGNALIESAALRPNSYVLDVAAGTGEPGLTAAARSPVPVAFDEPGVYFTFMNEVAAPVVAGMARADEAARARIRDTVIKLAAAQKTNGKVHLGGTALVVTGEK